MSQDDAGKTLGDYAGLLRRRWKYPVTIIPAALLVALFMAYVLPVVYESTGVIVLEASSLPEKMVPTTVTGSDDIFVYAGQQLDMTRRRVMTRDQLSELVKEVDPYPDLPDLSAREKAGLIMNNTVISPVDAVTYEPAEHSTAFAISYQNPNPDLAAAVADKLVDLFVTFNRRTRAEQAGEALKFLRTQSSQLEDQMRDMEKRLAQFKARYGDALPESQIRNLAGADRSQRDVEDLDRQILVAQEKESLLELQLSETSPSLMAAVSDWRVELAKLRAELAVAEQKYTPEHPDVKRLKRAIADTAALGAAGNAPVAKPDNPEYLRIRSQLSSVRGELGALRAAADRARADRTRFETNLSTAPNVEREYVQLDREYNNAQSRYQDLQNKIKDAALAQTLESEARGERFSLMKAPSTPDSPYSPNRLGIILLGIVLGGGITVLVAVMVDASDPTVRSSDDLQDIIEGTPIGAVPVILNRVDIRARRVAWGSVVAGYAAAALLVAVVVVMAK